MPWTNAAATACRRATGLNRGLNCAPTVEHYPRRTPIVTGFFRGAFLARRIPYRTGMQISSRENSNLGGRRLGGVNLELVFALLLLGFTAWRGACRLGCDRVV